MLQRRHAGSLRYDAQLSAWVSDEGPGVEVYRKADEDGVRVNGDAFCVGFIFGLTTMGVIWCLLLGLGSMSP
jgi:hypothetical protein